MAIDALAGLLLSVAICAGLAFVASLLLRTRPGPLGLVGAGLFGQGLGAWIAGLVRGSSWPGQLAVGSATVHLLWTFLGALLVLALFRYVPRWRR